MPRICTPARLWHIPLPVCPGFATLTRPALKRLRPIKAWIQQGSGPSLHHFVIAITNRSGGSA